MKRARPSKHYRVVHTRKGRKRVLVNRGIKKKVKRKSRGLRIHWEDKPKKKEYKMELDHDTKWDEVDEKAYRKKLGDLVKLESELSALQSTLGKKNVLEIDEQNLLADMKAQKENLEGFLNRNRLRKLATIEQFGSGSFRTKKVARDPSMASISGNEKRAIQQEAIRDAKALRIAKLSNKLDRYQKKIKSQSNNPISFSEFIELEEFENKDKKSHS